MYDPDKQQQQPPSAIVGGGGQALQGSIIFRLQSIWRAFSATQKLLLAGAGIVLAGIVLTGILILPPDQPNSQTTEQTSSPRTSTPGGANGAPSTGSAATENQTPANPPASGAQSTAKNGQQKSTGGSIGGSSSGGSSSGGSGGSSGGGSGGGSASCALPNYPNASCTGVPSNTTLAVVTGNMFITTPNTVVEGKDIRGCVSVEAPGVIIRKSKISCDNFLVVGSHASSYSGTGVLLEDVEISCNDTQGTAVGDYNITVRRANIHSCENGFDLDGSIVVEDSYVHDLIPYDVPTDPHVDGIQITPVGNDITIRHNTIDANNDGNAAIISPRVSSGIVSNILIQDNLLFGGGYTLYCQQDGSGNNYKVINNHFSTQYYPTVGALAPWVHCQDEAQVTGNVYHETGQPIPF